MINKRGFELAISTVIALIIGILVLILLVLFLTTGFGDFGDTIKNYFSYSNVDRVTDSCNFLSGQNSQYSFCCEKQKVKYYANNSKAEEMLTCSELSKKGFVSKLNTIDCSEVKCS